MSEERKKDVEVYAKQNKKNSNKKITAWIVRAH